MAVKLEKLSEKAGAVTTVPPFHDVSFMHEIIVVKLPDYIAHAMHDGRNMCRLIMKDIGAIQHTLTEGEHGYILTELSP